MVRHDRQALLEGQRRPPAGQDHGQCIVRSDSLELLPGLDLGQQVDGRRGQVNARYRHEASQVVRVHVGEPRSAVPLQSGDHLLRRLQRAPDDNHERQDTVRVRR